MEGFCVCLIEEVSTGETFKLIVRVVLIIPFAPIFSTFVPGIKSNVYVRVFCVLSRMIRKNSG